MLCLCQFSEQHGSVDNEKGAKTVQERLRELAVHERILELVLLRVFASALQP